MKINNGADNIVTAGTETKQSGRLTLSFYIFLAEKTKKEGRPNDFYTPAV